MPGGASVTAPLRRGAIVLLAFVLAGCGSAPPPNLPQPFSGNSGRATSVRLIVQNRNFSDARLYALRSGRRTALGVVGGLQDAEFTLDWVLPEPLRIEIDMLAGPRCSTEEMQVDPGDILELQIDAVFSRSSACGYEVIDTP